MLCSAMGRARRACSRCVIKKCMIITIHLTKIVVRLCQGSMCFSLTIQDGITAVDAASLGEHADVVDILMKARADANPMVS